MWYSIRLRDRGQIRYLHKRYTDFRALHEQLAEVWPRALPRLPPQGLVGMRHRLDIGKFNERRQCGLQSYLEALLAQARPLSSCVPLATFLGELPGRAACVVVAGPAAAA